MNKITIDVSKCTGCHQCVLTCGFIQSNTFDQRTSHIRVVQWEDLCLSVPIMCQQCDDAQCIAACPTEALSHDPASGIIVLDVDGCIKCEACAVECTYQVMHMTEEALPVTCDLCHGSPQCVLVCYPGALKFEEVPDKQREPLRELSQVLNARLTGKNVRPPAVLMEMADLRL